MTAFHNCRPEPNAMKRLPPHLLAFFLSAFWILPSSFAAAPRPNFVFLLADDLRWNTLGCMGDKIVRTPNIDRLAREGVLFRNAFVSTSICSVSRACIFTGQHERRHGIIEFDKPFTREQWAQTYPAQLRAAGYRTGFIGKWGVGEKPDQVAAMAPHFDYFKGLPNQGGWLFIDPKDPTRTHTTARMGGEALEFIAGCQTDQPFCLSVSFNSPHARDGKPREFQPDDRDEPLYTEARMSVPKTATDEFFQLLPPSVQRSISRPRWALRFDTPEKFQRTLRDYYRLVSGIDREVGRLREELARRGLAENTIIIFTSDNGFFFGERGLADKWYLYEESARVPLVICDPRLPAGRRGTESSAMTLHTDFAPTLLDYAGVKIPTVVQGRSLRPLMEKAQPPSDWRTEFFYEHLSVRDKIAASEGVRTERWTLIRWLDEKPVVEELYDTANDPFQERNLIAETRQARTLADLRERLTTLRKAAE